MIGARYQIKVGELDGAEGVCVNDFVTAQGKRDNWPVHVLEVHEPQHVFVWVFEDDVKLVAEAPRRG